MKKVSPELEANDKIKKSRQTEDAKKFNAWFEENKEGDIFNEDYSNYCNDMKGSSEKPLPKKLWAHERWQNSEIL